MSDKQPRQIRITELGLSTRTVNHLHYEGIKTVAGLLRKSQSDLLAIRGFGRTATREVTRALADVGLSLRADPDESENEAARR